MELTLRPHAEKEMRDRHSFLVLSLLPILFLFYINARPVRAQPHCLKILGSLHPNIFAKSSARK